MSARASERNPRKRTRPPQDAPPMPLTPPKGAVADYEETFIGQ